MTRVARAWHAFLTDPGSTAPSANVLAMNGAQAFAPEQPPALAQPIAAAQPLNLQASLTPIQPPVSSSQPTSQLQSEPLQSELIQRCEPTSAAPALDESLAQSPVRDVAPSSEQFDVLESHFEELAAVGKVLRLLEHQLNDVNKDVEESVAGVCSGFHGMAQRTQAAVAAARSATLGSAQNGDTKSPLEEMHQALEDLLLAVQASCSFSQTATEKLAQLEKRLGGVEKIVTEVEDIAGRAKMVALNGRIEASRLGPAGKAFGVVAQETKELAEKAGKTGCSIRESINELARELFQTTADMRKRSDSDIANFQKTNSEVRQLLTKLEHTHSEINAAMTTTASISVELQSDIGEAVMSMQFQDRVSQRVSHVMEALEGIVELIIPWCADANPEAAQHYFETWQADFASRYTMESERDASFHVGSHIATALKKPNGSSVELF